MSSIFISYSRKDGEFAERLEEALRARGKTVWRDVDDIPAGTEWRDEIHSGLETCDGVVFVISPDSLGSDECGGELRQALDLKKRVIPVMHREPDGNPVPDDLAKIDYVWLRPEDDFERGVTELIEALDTDFEWVRFHTRLGMRAAEWQGSGRKSAYLLRGSDLRDAESRLSGAAGKDPEPTAVQLEYLNASHAHARRRSQVLLASVSFALLVAIVLSVVALVERGAARDSQRRAFSRQLAADAETQLSIDPELSVLLASKGYDVSPTAESLAVLRHALVTSQIRMTVRPSDRVSRAALTPDRRTLFTVGRRDGVVRMWRYPGGAALGTIPGVHADPGQMSLSPRDGRVLVVDRKSGRARVFQGRGGQLSFGSAITAATWGGGGRLIVTGARNGTVAIFNGRTGAEVTHDRHTTDRIVAVGIDNGSRQAVAMAASGQVLLYDLRRHSVSTLQSGCGGGGKVLLSPNGARLLTYGASCAATLWNTGTRKEVGNLSSYAQGVNDAAFSPDGSYLVLASEVAVVLNPDNGSQTGQYLGHDGFVKSVAFVDGSASVATGGQDGTIRLWDPGNPTATTSTLRANVGSVGTVSAAEGGRAIVSVDGDGSAARVWASGASAPRATLGNPVVSATGALSSDGKLAIGDDSNGALDVFDPRTGRSLAPLVGSHGADTATSGDVTSGFADDGRIAYLLAGGRLRAWRTSDGAAVPVPVSAGYTVRSVTAGERSPWLLAVLVRPNRAGGLAELVSVRGGRASVLTSSAPDAAAMDPRGSVVAVAEGNRVRLMHPGSTSSSSLVVGDGPTRTRKLAFSADGRRLAVGGDGFIDVFSASDGKAIRRPFSVSYGHLGSLALSRDGRIVVGGFSDLRARVWDVATQQLLMTAKEPQQPTESGLGVNVVRISPDGNFLLTAAPGASDVEIWDILTGARLYAFDGFFAGWSTDARTVLTIGGPLRAWVCEVCLPGPELRKFARSRVTRGFTPGERAKFLKE